MRETKLNEEKKSGHPAAARGAASEARLKKRYITPRLTVYGKLGRLAAGSGSVEAICYIP